MARIGRPPKDNPKDLRLQVRINQSTLDKLDICVKAEKSTRSEIVRKGIDLVANQLNKK